MTIALSLFVAGLVFAAGYFVGCRETRAAQRQREVRERLYGIRGESEGSATNG